MSDVLLQLKHCREPQRQVDAWLIPAGDAAAWIDEMCRWRLPMDALRLYPVPSSSGDRIPAGLLVVLPPGAVPAVAPRALPYGLIAAKLLVPVDASLWPPVEPRELTFSHALHLFHPGIGMIGFEAADALRVADLLRPPPDRLENWNFARPGAALSERLLAVGIEVYTTAEDLYGEAPNEIAKESPEELPPSPEESTTKPVRQRLKDARGQIAKALHKFLQGVPHSSGGKQGWREELERWASRHAQSLNGNLDQLRQQTISRLLHLLESEPEEGLRHAIPLSGIARRGQAPPSANLGTRNPDFDLNSLLGGQLADTWYIEAQIRSRLQKRYRELATREIQLGRFRRAAYIFAELLGDLDSAAAALQQGRHFREAAVIYRDHLRRPLQAAECLVKAGLFADAIAIYDEKCCFLQSGDLYARIGQLEQARIAYRNEVAKRRLAGDHQGAAKVLQEQLGEPAEAYETLVEGWLTARNFGKCLELAFDLAAQHSWHDRARKLLLDLGGWETRTDKVAPLVQVLATMAGQYPDRLLRQGAADLARVKISERLDAVSRNERETLLKALKLLAPDDKLLSRDVGRFLSQFARPAPLANAAPFQIREFELPGGICWHAARSCGRHFFAAGMRAGNLVLVRGHWEGHMQMLSWECRPVGRTPLLVELDEESQSPHHVFVTPSPSRPLVRLAEQAFPAEIHFPGLIPAGVPEWLPDDMACLTTRGGFVWYVRHAQEAVVFECRDFEGRLISSESLTEAFTPEAGSILPNKIAVSRDFLWLASERELCLYRGTGRLKTWVVESPILSLIGSSPHLRACVAARLERGVALVWPESFKDMVEVVCDELTQPLACFTGDGTLVLLSANEGRICEVSPTGVGRVQSFAWPGVAALALVRAEGLNQVGVLTKDGAMHLLRI